jgi:hypothetical protein
LRYDRVRLETVPELQRNDPPVPTVVSVWFTTRSSAVSVLRSPFNGREGPRTEFLVLGNKSLAIQATNHTVA